MPKASASSARSAKVRKKARKARVAVVRKSSKPATRKPATLEQTARQRGTKAAAAPKTTPKARKGAAKGNVSSGGAKPRRKTEKRPSKSLRPRVNGRVTNGADGVGKKPLDGKGRVSVDGEGARTGQQLKFGFGTDRSPLAVLQKQNRSLLLRIAKRRAQVESSKRAIEELLREMAERVVPYREELFAITREVSDLGEKLLDSNWVPVGQREKVRWVLRQLLATLPVEEAEAGRAHAVSDDEEHRGADGVGASKPPFERTPRAGRGEMKNDESEVVKQEPPPAVFVAPPEPSSPHPGEAHQPEAVTAAKPAGDQSGALRTLFKKLAITYHPDRVQDDSAKAARTLIMKDLTRAFERGDLAKLVELEGTLALKYAPAQRETEERQLERLGRANDELRQQLRELELELERVKEDSPFTLDLRRRDPARIARDELDEIVLGRHLEVERAAKVREFVASFAAGRMKAADFVKGPPHLRRSRDAELMARQVTD